MPIIDTWAWLAEKVDEDFDFEETMRAIHAELQELNAEAVELTELIAMNYEGLWG
jgi:type I restriction enzyme M protein